MGKWETDERRTYSVEKGPEGFFYAKSINSPRRAELKKKSKFDQWKNKLMKPKKKNGRSDVNATVMPMEEFLAPPPRPPRRASLPHTTDEEEDKLRIRGNSILLF